MRIVPARGASKIAIGAALSAADALMHASRAVATCFRKHELPQMSSANQRTCQPTVEAAKFAEAAAKQIGQVLLKALLKHELRPEDSRERSGDEFEEESEESEEASGAAGGVPARGGGKGSVSRSVGGG